MKAFDKKDGSGAYNWGTPGDELAVSEETQGFGSPPKDTEETPVDADAEATPDAEVLSGDENKENVEETAPEMTFAEYRKLQEESRVKPEFNLRKVDDKVKGMKEVKKQTEEEKEEDGSLYFPKKYYEEKYKTSGRERVHMDLNFQYGAGDNRHMDSERGRRGGRGRGRGRGRGGGRGEDRGGDAPARNDSPVESGGFGGGFGSSTTTPNDPGIALEDDAEFPTLG